VALRQGPGGGGGGGGEHKNCNVNDDVVPNPCINIKYVTPGVDVQEYDADVPAQDGPLSSIPPTQVGDAQVP
jgi:hypothetical protein